MSPSIDPAKKIVGIEASVSSFRAVSLGDAGEIIGTETSAFDPTAGTPAQLNAVISTLQDKFGPFDRIGVAVPGLIRRESGRVAYSARIPEHSAIDLANEIHQATGVKAYVENDANAAAYGELKLGAGRGSSNLFYATLGVGVGGALILDNQIWRGVSGFAGEFGYVTINSDGMRLEDVASAANIVRRTRTRFNRDSTSSLNKLEEQQISIYKIVEAAEKGDDFASLMLERTGSYVGTAIATVINLLNIEKIVIGGEIMHAGHLVLDAVVRRARELSFGPSFEHADIAAGELAENAAAIGAALLANES
ncbi:MAG TPA: ROK family protein [Pyrinomonadaceae bacterium]|nr:ROK family protein [Pyrinomonadaceae bacterium]